MNDELETVDYSDDNETFVLTPKGIFLLSLLETGLIRELDDNMASIAWNLFSLRMEKHGYIQTEENDIERKLP